MSLKERHESKQGRAAKVSVDVIAARLGRTDQPSFASCDTTISKTPTCQRSAGILVLWNQNCLDT
ncbi:hypothetical protein [Yoonia sp.]|uniref:hypothetical protein n=1 Tax=Yoonia sp. TaxID=2212373 RepID=UPI00390CBF9B